jgi:hypothetical protein
MAVHAAPNGVLPWKKKLLITIEQERPEDSGFVQDSARRRCQNRVISFSGGENVNSGCESGIFEGK